MVQRIASTPEGKRRLDEELRRLRAEDRPRIIAAIEEAREKGDLSENSEYDAAKEAQLQLSQRIQEIEDCLSRIEVVHARDIQDKDRVAFSATVTIVDVNTDEERTYQIVGGHESDITLGKISLQSPVGSALIGKRVGDLVAIKTPRGVVEYEVTNIVYQ